MEVKTKEEERERGLGQRDYIVQFKSINDIGIKVTINVKVTF